MRILDVLSDTPWAIIPDKKFEIDSIYISHTRREKIDLDAVEKKLGAPLNNQPKGYEVVKGVAVLPIEGVIAKRMSLMTRISGGVSTSYLQNDFRQALSDPSVKAIILQIDSPGGAVDGTQELANLIHASRGEKPIVALADGLMASAAYWIGAAADQIFMTSETTQVGSIGVVATHVDVSKAEEQAGYKTTEITAGTYKRVASQYSPLTPEGRASIQDQVDSIYSVFLSDVAKFRGIDSTEAVHERMADGRIFIGQGALDAGLVDGYSTLSDLIDSLASGNPTNQSPRRAAGAVVSRGAEAPNAEVGRPSDNATSHTKGKDMNKEQILAEHPEIFEAIKAEGFEAGLAKGREEGASAELSRVKSVFDASIPGHDALIRDLAFDGKTTGGEAALKVIQAERDKKARVASNLKEDAVDPVKPSKDDAPSAVDPNAPIEERAQAEWNKSADVRAEFGGSFDSFLAFKKNEEAGLARVMKK